MLFSKSSLFAIAAAVGFASAQTYPDTPAGSVKTYVVTVSDKSGSLTFIPEEITAAPGDLVQFHFYPKNHSLAQSSFASPCSPLPKTNGTDGFWSGFMPVTAADTTMPVFSVLVKDTNPIWFYCATAKHCQSGMSGVINAPASAERTLALYKEAAKSVVVTGIPVSAAGTGGGNNTSSGNGTGTGSGSDTPTTTNQPEVNTPNPNSASALGASSAFALIAAAVIAALAL